jgi:signal transduction histidine kinase
MLSVAAAGRIVAAGAGVGLLVVSAHVWTRHDRPTAATFAGLLAVVGTTALCTAVLSHDRVAYKLVWLYGFLGIPLVFARFGFDYYGLDAVVSCSRWVVVAPAAAAGGAGSLLLLGTPAAVEGMTPPLAVLAPISGLFVDLLRAVRELGMYYATGLMLLAVGLVVRSVHRYDHLDPALGVALAFVGSWPWVAYVVSPALTARAGSATSLAVIASCYGMTLAAALFAYARRDVLETAPAVGNAAPERVLDAIEDPVVVVTDDWRLLRLNEAATTRFGVTETAAIGGDLTGELGIDPAALEADEPVELPTVTGSRRFELTTSAIEDRTDTTRGTAVLCRDVSRRETREQRLQVLNRVMRHNLRNDMNAILGRAELITDGGTGAVADHASRIKHTAEGLASMGERAREVDRMLSVPSASATATPVRSVLRDVVDELAEQYPTTKVTTAIGADLRARVHAETLRVVLRNLVDNACRHNDADEPLVVVSAERTDCGRVTIAVADNGPGLPAVERRPIETGTEQPLEHGSGLGLWTAHWGVKRMGGELTFGSNEPRGTVIRLELPAADHQSAE